MTFFSKKTTILFIKINVLCAILLTGPVHAYEFTKNSGLENTGKEIGINTAKAEASSIGQQIINLVLPFLGTVYLLLMVYAGYIWMMAQGNEEDIKKAKKIIINSTIALSIVLLSYAISYYVISLFQFGLVKGT